MQTYEEDGNPYAPPPYHADSEADEGPGDDADLDYAKIERLRRSLILAFYIIAALFGIGVAVVVAGGFFLSDLLIEGVDLATDTLLVFMSVYVVVLCWKIAKAIKSGQGMRVLVLLGLVVPFLYLINAIYLAVRTKKILAQRKSVEYPEG